MEMALTFNSVTLSPVNHNNSLWIRATELARALGYSDESKVSRIYRAHAEEFTPDMVQTLEIAPEAQNGLPGKARIFSLRGCHLLAMFARTPVAKAFRKWVLDVLDRLDRERQSMTIRHELADAPLTPDQQCTLRALVKARIETIPDDKRPKGLYPQVWSRFNNHFRIARYCQLPQSRMSEAIEYLTQMDLMPTALPQVSSSEIPNNSFPGLPVPVDAPKQLKALHAARQHCRFDFAPQAYSANDREAAERNRLANDLYMLQDNLWAALYNICSAAARLRA